MDEYKGMPAHDAGLLAAAQAVEHYEMTRYGTLRTWAEELGYSKSVTLLQQTLDEERATDAALTNLAKAVINSGRRERRGGLIALEAAPIKRAPSANGWGGVAAAVTRER